VRRQSGAATPPSSGTVVAKPSESAVAAPLCQRTPKNQTTANDLSRFISTKNLSKMPNFQVERTRTELKFVIHHDRPIFKSHSIVQTPTL
jgi:hypothetical protein